MLHICLLVPNQSPNLCFHALCSYQIQLQQKLCCLLFLKLYWLQEVFFISPLLSSMPAWISIITNSSTNKIMTFLFNNELFGGIRVFIIRIILFFNRLSSVLYQTYIEMKFLCFIICISNYILLLDPSMCNGSFNTCFFLCFEVLIQSFHDSRGLSFKPLVKNL